MVDIISVMPETILAEKITAVIEPTIKKKRNDIPDKNTNHLNGMIEHSPIIANTERITIRTILYHSEYTQAYDQSQSRL